jgi:hypothetical protein
MNDAELTKACYAAHHARIWSNHALRYEPTLCEDCQLRIFAAKLPVRAS